MREPEDLAGVCCRRLGRTLLIAAAMAGMAAHGADIASISGVPPGRCKPPHIARPWLDRNQTPECRALEAIAALSREEKIYFDGGGFELFGTPQVLRNARPARASTAATGAAATAATKAAASAAASAARKLGLPPLGGGNDGPNGIATIADLLGGPLPERSAGVTAFPNVVTLAATWDRGLARRFGLALGEEFRGKGLSADFGPTINIVRTWHDGRSAETFGEDPYLTGELAVAEILAMQSRGVIATVKHYDANDQEFARTGVYPDMAGVDEHIGEKALEEIYLPQFKAAIERARAGAVMCAYVQVNGEFSCDGAALLGRLRAWGFDGVIVPDAAFAQRDVVAAANAGVDGASPVEQVAAAIRQGRVDPAFFDRKIYHELVTRFRLGLYDEPAAGSASAVVSTPQHLELAREIASSGAVLLKNAGGVLPLEGVRSIAVLGADAGSEAVVMETGSAHVHVGALSVPLDAIRARAGPRVRVAYERGSLGVRPLPAVPSDVLSPPSGSGHGLRGVYFGTPYYWKPVLTRIDSDIEVGADPHVPAAPPGTLGAREFARGPEPWSAKWTGTLMPPATGLYGFSLTAAGTAELYIDDRLVASIQQADFSRTVIGTAALTAGHRVSVLIKYDTAAAILGAGLRLGWQPPDGRLARAVEAARHADVAIVFAGEQLGEGYDKISFGLPGDEDRLIEAVAAASPRTVVVLNTSTPVAMPWIDRVAAVIEAWYPGEEAGASIASLLFGDVSPSGKLPVTFPRNDTQGPATHWLEYPGNGRSVVFDEGVLVGYRWYQAKHQQPLFPFGYGLSYTTFQLGDLVISGAGADRTVSVSVRNTGRRAGAEVVQLYVGLPPAANDPPRQLKGFEKVQLRPGEMRTVRLPLPDAELGAYDERSGEWRLFPGTYTVMVGVSSHDIRESGRFVVEQDASHPTQ